MGVRCAIVTDLKRGHENQSRVLARMLGDTAPLTMQLRKNVREGGPAELQVRLRLALFGPGSISRRQANRLVERYLEPASKWDFRDFAMEVAAAQGSLKLYTISTGTPPATFNLVLTRLLKATSIANMTPSLIPRSAFDLNIVPVHDLTNLTSLPVNVIVTPLALGHHDQAAGEALAGQLALERGLDGERKYWGVAIGGPSKACPWAGDRVLDELAALHGLARGEQAQLLVTTSRRTPAWCLSWLNKHYVASPQVAYFLNAAEDPLNPLPAFYELAERMFVTGDSFSMVCEAAQAGHVPVVLRVREGSAPGKLGRALSALDNAGLAIVGADAEELPARLTAEPVKHAPNAHYDELKKAVRYKLGLE